MARIGEHERAIYLDVDHEMQVRLRDVSQERALRSHLIIWHRLDVERKTLREIAWLHLLAHVVMGDKDLKRRVGIDRLNIFHWADD